MKLRAFRPHLPALPALPDSAPIARPARRLALAGGLCRQGGVSR